MLRATEGLCWGSQDSGRLMLTWTAYGSFRGSFNRRDGTINL